MYLYGQDSKAATSGSGAVISLADGNLYMDKPWTHSWYLKYYYQPRATYVQHTMNGLADSMNGFSGPGIGMDWVVRKNVQLSLEGDYLKDLQSGEHKRTIWSAITYYFGDQ
jgi:hypothetical protein